MRIPSPILVLTQLAAIALAPITAPVPAQPLPSAVVAYTGQIAPGTGGATYFLLYQPTITAVGDVAFRAEIAGAGVNGTNNKGYWRQSDGGPVGLFLRAGNPTPLPGTTWSTDVGSPTAQAVGGAARTGFYWGLLDGGPVKGALWSEQPGGVRAVAVQGDPAPGIPGATYQPGLPIFDTNFDEAGELLFRAAVTGGGATSANDEGLWIDDGTTTSLVVREGEPAPGFPAGTFFPGIQSPNARVAPGSGVTFWANPFVPVLALNQTGIWSNRTGGLTPVALQGNSAPGLGPGETIGPGLPFANRAGQIAFFSPIFGGAGGAGLWISDAGGTPALAYRAPATDAPFQLLGSQFFLADNGIFYEISNTFGSGTARQAIVAVGPSGWSEVVHVGERVAGLNAGIVYSLLDQYLVNANGQVAFRATITGPGVTGANNKVLVAEGSDGSFHLVARTASSLEVSPGLFRTISGLNLTQITGGGPGVLRGFADNGALTWFAGTGGISSAILVTSPGVPPSVQLVGLEVDQVIQSWNNSVPLVEGKQTFVRAFFESSQTMEIEPRLLARPAGGGPDLLFSPLSPVDIDGSRAIPGVAAQRGQLSASTQWQLPIAWTLGDLELEVVLIDRPLDCLEAAQSTPNDCKVSASFQPAPRPEIRFVSVDYVDAVSGVQSVSPQRRLELAQRLVSAFPIDGLIWSGSAAHWPSPVPPAINSCFLYKWIHARKLLDGCDDGFNCRTLYYGAVLSSGISGCANLGGYSGAGYMPPNPLAKGRHAHTHEVAHMLWQDHSVDPLQNPLPNGHLPGFCGENAEPGTSEFPYIFEIGGQRRPTLGPMESGENSKIFGFDTLQRRPVEPDQFFELMSYCQADGIHFWPSKYTYSQLKAEINGRYGSASAPPPETPTGSTEHLLVHGWVDPAAGSATFDPFLALPAGGLLPAPAPGAYTLRVHRIGGGIEDVSFVPEVLKAEFEAPTQLPFFLDVSSPETVASIELRQGTDLLATESASANAPTVLVLSPNGGELIDTPTVEVSWAAGDTDGDLLLFVVQFSGDGGATWTTLETNTTQTNVTIDRAALAGTTDGLLRVQASDGLRTASDESDGAFTVADNAPEIAIVLPQAGQLYYDGQVLVLEAMTLDPEDGALTGAALEWSSSLDGLLGTGSPLSLAVDQLTEGLHVLTLTATDSAANVVQVSLQIRVDQPALVFEDDFESGGTTRWQ